MAARGGGHAHNLEPPAGSLQSLVRCAFAVTQRAGYLLAIGFGIKRLKQEARQLSLA